MTLERDPRPRHQQVAAELRAQIMDGTRAGKLPRTEDLAADFDVATSTITKVLNSLREEGLIQTTRGHGAATYAADWAAHVVDASTYIEPAGSLSYGRPHVEEVDAPGDVAKLLGVQRTLMRRRTTLDDGAPIELSESHFDIRLARELGLDTPRKIRGGVQAALEGAGFPFRKHVDVVSSREPTSAELVALELPTGVNVLRVLRAILSDDARVVCVDVIAKGVHKYQERYEVVVS